MLEGASAFTLALPHGFASPPDERLDIINLACDGAQVLFQVAQKFSSQACLIQAFRLLLMSSHVAARRGQCQPKLDNPGHEGTIGGHAQDRNHDPGATMIQDLTSSQEPPILKPDEEEVMRHLDDVIEVTFVLLRKEGKGSYRY